MDNKADIKIKIAQKIIKERKDKYFDLVWYARKTPENMKIKVVKDNMKKIREKYKNEIAELENDNSSWVHGFNSGMLASLRLISGILNDMPNELFENEETGEPLDTTCNCKIEENGEITHTNDDCKMKAQIEFATENFPMLDT
jgi:hypothetical protein